MLTREENERLTRVGPGTPGGELLRRYWYPVATLDDLTEESPTRLVRLLGEDLVLFRDKSGRVGLLADHCSHRGASLLYGRVEERGIACAYHGWLYDTQGNCLECPAEPAGSLFHLTVKHRAYPVEVAGGLYWAYLGPAPAPILPRYDALETGHIEHIMEFLRIDANWLQVVENNLDQAHVLILHQDTGGGGGGAPINTTRGLIDRLRDLEYRETPYGIMRRMETTDGYVEEDPLIFPNMLRRMNQLVINVPVDDTHTKKFDIFFGLGEGASDGDSEHAVEHYVLSNEEAKLPPDQHHPYPRHRMDRLRLQDYMAVETQGPVSPRETWRMGTSDRGLNLFWQLLLREIEKVERGLDPIGVIRDADHAFVDTNLGQLHAAGVRPSWPEGVLVYPTREMAGVP
jgi:5,5'-dehydrodivanillate O-demethylase